MVAESEIFFLYVKRIEPVAAEASPVFEPLQIRSRPAEKLKLHLLEFARAEGEVARRNLVPEGLSDLADAERNLFPGGSLDVLEIDEDTLRCLRTEIDGVLRVLRDALEGLEHQVKLTDIGKVVLSAGRAGNLVVIDECLHLHVAHRVHTPAQIDPFRFAEILGVDKEQIGWL